ncbi:MAG: hypothetical protein WD604_05735 [Balneolaceae bacterium]
MTEQEAKSLFMDYLYDEMESKEKQEFEQFLKQHPALAEELKELSGTRSLLQHVPLKTPSHKLVMMNPEATAGKQWIYHPYTRAALAVAATFLMVVLSFSLIDVQFGQAGQGFFVTFGNQNQTPVTTEQGINEEEVYELIEQIRAENALLLASVIEQSEEQQQLQLEQTIETLTDYYDKRRQQDLLLITEGLAQLEEETYYRFLQTDEALGDLIYALSYQQTQSE